LKLGAARIHLDWPVGLPLAGYVRRTLVAVGYHRPLYIRALVASSGKNHICLLNVETLCVDAELTARIRREVSLSMPIATEAIMVTATHTHAAPGGIARFPIMTGAESFLNMYAPDRVEFVVEACLQAVHEAIHVQTPVTLQFGSGMTQDIAANRRDADGIHDPRLPFVVAHDLQGAVQAVIFSYACHSTILGADNLLYSGDLSGTTSALIEAQWDTVALGLTGATGDVSTRFTRRESSVAEVERMARQLAGLLTTSSRQPIADETVDYAQTWIDLPLKPVRNKDIVQQELVQAITRLEHVIELAERRIAETAVEGLQLELTAQERPAYLTTEVQVLRLGDVYMVGFPGEMFVEYGLELTQALVPQPVLIAGYANDYIGYVPTPDAHNGYEADVAIMQPNAGHILLAQAEIAVSQCRRMDS
jgi:neutral ceramidase